MAHVTILKQRGNLIVPLQSALSDTEMTELRDVLAGRVGTDRARGVVIDVTALDVIDSFACRMLRSMAEVNRLRGAETIIVGIQPDVAFAMVQLGLSVRDVMTMLDAEEAVAFLDRQALEAK